MKIVLALLLLVGHLASGQTLFNVRLTGSWNGTFYSAGTNIVAGTNQTIRLLNFLVQGNLNSASATVHYPGLGGFTLPIQDNSIFGVPILGPATNYIECSWSGNAVPNEAVFLVQLDTVNTAASPGGTMIQPAGFASTLALQTSTNLTTWTTLTNTIWGKTNTSRFFRMSQSIP